MKITPIILSEPPDKIIGVIFIFNMKITPIILSGGSGTRLWPLSRSLNPKQFLSFFGDKSLFADTALRIKEDEDFHDPVVVCNNEHRF